MHSKAPLHITIATVFIWIGFVCAISFMEAWLKFRAPGITLPLGLGIGRLVFDALNKVEIVLSAMIAISMIFSQENKPFSYLIFFLIPLLIVLIQTIWMLPALDVRAESHIIGEYVADSKLHFYYVFCEVVKLISLLLLGINLFKLKKQK